MSNSLDNSFVSKLNSYLSLYNDEDLADFQRQEILHYCTDTSKIPHNPELDYVISEYKKLSNVTINLQTPTQTFGEELKTQPCIKCKSTNVASQAIQTRSADEPTSYFHECRQCLHRWKDR